MHFSLPLVRKAKALVIGALLVCSSTTQATQLSGVNHVEFIGTGSLSHLGNGFVVEYEGRYFGVTAKHVLLMANKSGLNSTDIKPRLKSWVLKPNQNDAGQIHFGDAVNGNAQETLDEGVLLQDALVFELDHFGEFTPIKLATASVQPGDQVRAVGCSYQRAKACVQDEYAGQIVGRRGPNLLIDLGSHSLNTLFGLSGAPVMNTKGELIGIVSNALPDDNGVERFAPVDTAYLRDVLRAYVQSKLKR